MLTSFGMKSLAACVVFLLLMNAAPGVERTPTTDYTTAANAAYQAAKAAEEQEASQPDAEPASDPADEIEMPPLHRCIGPDGVVEFTFDTCEESPNSPWLEPRRSNCEAVPAPRPP